MDIPAKGQPEELRLFFSMGLKVLKSRIEVTYGVGGHHCHMYL